jgi:hypothetical protein
LLFDDCCLTLQISFYPLFKRENIFLEFEGRKEGRKFAGRQMGLEITRYVDKTVSRGNLLEI